MAATKRRKAKKLVTKARSAKSGKYVSKAQAKRRPSTTVLERERPR